MGKLYAISDVHVSYKFNLDAFTEFFTLLPSKSTAENSNTTKIESEAIATSSPSTVAAERDRDSNTSSYFKDFTEDGLVLAGDLGEKLEHLRICFKLATQKFKTVWWVPGNHELYTLPSSSETAEHASYESEADRDLALTYRLKGEAKYIECCRIANEYGVLTPEDEFIRWDYEVKKLTVRSGGGVEGVGSSTTKRISKTTTTTSEAVLVCPIFTLYDYSFRPADVPREKALDWAMEHDVKATDEVLLHPDPYATRDEWCEQLIRKTEDKLFKAQSRGLPLVLINHWPLREDLITIPSIPRFSLWCGSKKTEDWHKRFNAKVVVTGHLHVRRTDWRDGCRFEEVSLGYPKQWEGMRMIGRGVGDAIREILPGEYGERDQGEVGSTIWRRNG